MTRALLSALSLSSFPPRLLSLPAAREVAPARRRPGGEGDAERAEMLNSAHWTVASYASVRPLL